MGQDHKENSLQKALRDQEAKRLLRQPPAEEVIAARISHEDTLTLVSASVRRAAEHEERLHASWINAGQPDPNKPASPIDDVKAAIYSLESSISQTAWLAEETGTPLTVEQVKSMNPADLAKRVANVMFGESPDLPYVHTELDTNALKAKR